MRQEPCLNQKTATITRCREQQQRGVGQYLRLVTFIAAICLSVSAGATQDQPKTTTPPARKAAPHKAPPAGTKPRAKKTEPDFAWLQDILKNHELMTEFGQLAEKLQKGIHYPEPRNQSQILSRLPESTVFYVAFPNYGDSLHQALQIFQQEVKDSAPLHDFLQKNKYDEVGPKIENGIQKFYEFSEYLGNEIVITGKLKGQTPTGVMVAEIKKPGIRDFLEKINTELITNKTDRLRIFDPDQLAATDGKDAGEAPVVLVRKDLIAVGLNISSLREFNTQIDQAGTRFASNPLGQRLAHTYREGTNSVIGVDLQKLMALLPPFTPQQRMLLEKSGFGDVQYLVTENTTSKEHSSNHGELTFSGPRHGIASWLAAPAPMGGLDFISAKAASAGAIRLKSPALMFDDVQEIAGPAAFAMLPQMEAQMNVNLKQDLLGKLTGEIAFETQAPAMMGASVTPGLTAAQPDFKIILGVTDPAGLQQTLKRLLVAAPMQSGQREEDGVTINTLTMPGPEGQNEINYFFMDGYLVVCSGRAGATEAVRAHRSWDSLLKSSKLREALGEGHPAKASLMFYQNAGEMIGPLLANLSPELRQLLPVMGNIDVQANVFSAYADESAIRGSTNTNVYANGAVAMVIAAVAVPNFLRSRISANESAAASTLRTVNTAQLTYATEYPAKGYASSLAALGWPMNGDCSEQNANPAHACLVDDKIGNASCTSGKWCEKNGYRFSVRGICLQTSCKGYVVTATPISDASGGKSFCSVNDAVIRMHSGAPLDIPLTAAACRTWTPIQ